MLFSTMKNLLAKFIIISFTSSFFSLTSLLASQPITDVSNFEQQLQKMSEEERTALFDEIKKAQQNFIDEKRNQLHTLISSVEFVLEHIGQVINNAIQTKQLGTINHREALEKISQLREVVDHLRKSTATAIDPTGLHITALILHEITDYVLELINTNFKTKKTLDIEALITRSSTHEPDVEKIEITLQAITKKVEAIKNKAHYMGLSLFHKVFRKIDSFITDYKVIPWAALAGTGYLMGYYIVSRMDDESLNALKARFPRFIDGFSWIKKNIFGPRPAYGKSENIHFYGPLLNADKLGIGGFTEHYLGERGIQILSLAIAPLITWKVLFDYCSPQISEIKMFTLRKWHGLRNWLKGLPMEQEVSGYFFKAPETRFKDVVGLDDKKETLTTIINFLTDPEFYLRAGIEINLGYLFCGPSRTGKTLLAEACAGEAYDKGMAKGKKINFMYVNAAHIHVFGLSDIFDYAHAYGPTIIFIDEIDMGNFQREKDAKALSELMTKMSGYQAHERNNPEKIVVVIAATNRPEALDQNLLKRGRFGKILHFSLPTQKERFSYLKLELQKRAILKISDEFLEKLAIETENCSFADLKYIIVMAMQMAKSENSILTEEHIERAFDQEVRNIINDIDKLSNLSAEQISIMAAHQAGHVIINMLLEDMPRITKVTLLPVAREIREEYAFARYDNDGKVKDIKDKKEFEYGKIFKQNAFERNAIVRSYNAMLNDCKVLLAGSVAQKILLGQVSSYHQEEREQALALVQKVVFGGIQENNLPKKIREMYREKAYQLLIELEKQVETMLMESKQMLVHLAEALEEKKTLTSLEVMEIMQKGLNSIEHLEVDAQDAKQTGQVPVSA